MFSKELEQSISSLFDQAQKTDIEYITIEHLLLMILSDFDVKDFLKSNGINVNSFKSSVEDYIPVSYTHLTLPTT